MKWYMWGEVYRWLLGTVRRHNDDRHNHHQHDRREDPTRDDGLKRVPNTLKYRRSASVVVGASRRSIALLLRHIGFIAIVAWIWLVDVLRVGSGERPRSVWTEWTIGVSMWHRHPPWRAKLLWVVVQAPVNLHLVAGAYFLV